MLTPASPDTRIDWKKLVEAIQSHIKSVNWTNRMDLRKMKIELINGLGYFRDQNTVAVLIPEKEDRVLRSKFVVVAIGSRPSLPNIIGANYAITTDELFSLDHAPGRTLVVGAGCRFSNLNPEYLILIFFSQRSQLNAQAF